MWSLPQFHHSASHAVSLYFSQSEFRILSEFTSRYLKDGLATSDLGLVIYIYFHRFGIRCFFVKKKKKKKKTASKQNRHKSGLVLLAAVLHVKKCFSIYF